MPAKKAVAKAPKITANGKDSATIRVHRKLYPKDVLFGTAFGFLELAFIHLDVADKEHIEVSMRVKPGKTSLSPRDLAGEFANELINQAIRLKLAKDTEKVRATIIERAIAQSVPIGDTQPRSEPSPAPDLPPEIAKILAEEDDSLDFLDDPLGIAVPWEEKYGKKDKEEDSKSGPDKK